MSTVIKKKILTEDDLLRFCEEQKFARFSSKDTGYQLAVKVPTTFEVDNNVDDNHRGMMKLKFRIFHTGLNRNKSYVSNEAAEKAMNTIADRPVLAAIHQLDDGTWDFEGHEMEVIKDENGNEETRYIESQVGSFSSEPAFWEHDDKLNKDYVCAYAYISEEYTKTCDIIRQKNGSKNSCELFIDDLSYNAKEHYLELNDFYVNASTLLGSHDDGTKIEEGMQGSRADIADFSVENNSVKFDKNDKLIELLESLNEKLSNFNKYDSKEGGNEKNMTKFEELLQKYNKIVDDINFEYENMSDEELEQKFAELFDEEVDDEPQDDDTTPSEDEGVESDSTVTTTEDTNTKVDGNNDDKNKSDLSTDDTLKKKVKNEVLTKTFEISHDDIRYALYNLLSSYEEADNTWYCITGVYGSYFVYENWDGGQIYGQKYTKDNDNVAFDGERYTLHKEYLTDSEFTELQSMRSNYAELKAFKETVEKNELHAQREEILASEKYSVISEKNDKGEYVNEAFAKLVSEMDNYSLAELETQIKVIHSDFIAEHSTFSASADEKKSTSKKQFANPSKVVKSSRYGKLFQNK